MKSHSCCKSWQQGTQQPGLSFSQIKAEPASRWKKRPDEMRPKKNQVVGARPRGHWPSIYHGAIPSSPPTQQCIVQDPAWPATAKCVPTQLTLGADWKQAQDTCAPTILVLTSNLTALLAPNSTCFGPSSHNLGLASPTQPR